MDTRLVDKSMLSSLVPAGTAQPHRNPKQPRHLYSAQLDAQTAILKARTFTIEARSHKLAAWSSELEARSLKNQARLKWIESEIDRRKELGQ